MTTHAEYTSGQSSEGSAALTAWLASLVRNHDYGSLAELRRPRVRKELHYRAIWYSPTEDQREVYEQVAFLFAVYHQGRPTPRQGYGSLGEAARRIGSGIGRGPDDPGAARLVDRIVSSRRIPWRHLQHAVARLRSCDQQPPSWARLTDDLSRWNDRQARVPYEWAVAFHMPPSRASRPRNSTPSAADTTQKGSTT
ncbi:type I-E CRISPR-associated protein Cse2/CasB [Streptomyces antarcticus]|uniref:type I-E CRISPR-associated protein Cse2/CasB n=1 Tax=Streptomyces antarcticus TaxID=2996458 RepID=UPI00226DE4D1|nr:MULTISPECIES: type I-E CRISPR-associated protein Cse2/CasB [unclassified Streptomyces]MCY0947654.1 type I-E CRISPR-associated protein Cse2/CasB [Streptomyces sp. H34-AA3]MCZ4087465.1 type I-E CRISPR-associated protein Cse2/CasB [Streptomyces sp. H34-S5]